MTCQQCGNLIPDGSAACPACGAPCAQPESLPVKKKSKLPLIIVLIALVLLIGGGAAYVFFVIDPFGEKPEDAVLTYMDAFFGADGEAVADLYPEEMLAYFEDEYDADRDKIVKSVEEEIAEMDDFESWEVEYKVKKVKDGKEKKIEKLKEACEDEMELEITDLKYVVLEMKFEYKKDGEKEKEKNDVSIPVVKSKGKWYVFCLPDKPFSADYFIEKVTD